MNYTVKFHQVEKPQLIGATDIDNLLEYLNIHQEFKNYTIETIHVDDHLIFSFESEMNGMLISIVLILLISMLAINLFR